MEASETLTPSEDIDTKAAEHSPAEARHPQELFRYSEWVHVGPGAETCEDGDNGKCSDPLHFHAWCRLPNQFQHQSIREKAQAAKARRIRQFRDAESDASVSLDAELEEIEFTTGTEAARDTYIEEIVYRDFMKDYFDAVQELVNQEGEGDDLPKWETISEDQERLRALEALDPDQRPQDEYEALVEHIKGYEAEIERIVRDEKQAPVRESLQQRTLDELRGMVREQRVQKDAGQVYMQTYTVWEQFIGTLKPRDPAKGMPVERVFGSVEHLKAAAPEVVSALDGVFTNLDGEFGKTLTSVATGKS